MGTRQTAAEWMAERAIPEKFLGVVKAYSDLHDLDEQRDLDFHERHPFKAIELRNYLPIIIPGYNAFSKQAVYDLTAVFGEDSRYYVGREGSVALYVMPGGISVALGCHRWARLLARADEVSFEVDSGLFRFWWD